MVLVEFPSGWTCLGGPRDGASVAGEDQDMVSGAKGRGGGGGGGMLQSDPVKWPTGSSCAQVFTVARASKCKDQCINFQLRLKKDLVPITGIHQQP